MGDFQGGKDEIQFVTSLVQIPPPYITLLTYLLRSSQLLKNKTALLLFLQGFPGCLPWGLVYVFLNDYLSNDCGLR